jgi:DNA repair protein RecO (recombination protein O)
MDWTDQAIVLGARRQGEGSLILSLLTRGHGRHKGLVRGGAQSRQRGLYEAGNVVTARWRARLAEHLGQLQIESQRFHAADLLDDPLRLACLEATVAVAEAGLPERSPYPGVFDGLLDLLQRLSGDDGFAVFHLQWELLVLADLGYGLDLGACAVTGTAEDLAFVSPRSGRAVSRSAGAAYQDRLLILPRLLGGAGRGDSDLADLQDGLTLTGSFLDRHVFAPQQRGLPEARGRYIDRLARLDHTANQPTLPKPG